MNRWGTRSIGLLMLLVSWPLMAAVEINNQLQYVHVQVMGDGEVLDDYQSDNSGAGDSDLMEEAYYWGYAVSRAKLNTTYDADRLTVDGHVNLEVFPTWDFEEISARGHVYYQTSIAVTEEPVWLKISGYLTRNQDDLPNDHFMVGSPVWYWDAEYDSSPKAWMFDTALFDVGEHLIYGGVDYTLTTPKDGFEDTLYADYYFIVEVVEAPVFEPSHADLNHDGHVNIEDLSLFASAWMWLEEMPE